LAFGTLVAVTAPVFGQPSFRAAPLITDDLDPESLRLAIRRSLAYLEKLPPDRVVGAQPRRFTAGEIIHTLLAFEGLLNQWHCLECWRRELTRRFEFNPSSADHRLAEVLVTGYYQPLLEGSLARSASYAFPIYGRPRDLVVADKVTLGNHMAVEKVFGRVQRDHFLPYYSRREIDEAGALRGKNYEIAWVKDPIELFFLHIQGSGILRLSDGRRLHVGYSATNGRPYRSIGRLLIERGKISKTEVSMQSLRRYLAAHPDEIKEIFGYNESYVFFRFLQGGATGSLEVPVTPGRSIATDPNLFPKGAIAFIETQLPLVSGTGEMIGQRPFSRFVLNQDSGGSIRGPQRVDLFFGAGADVEAQAGYMNSAGKLYFLSLKNQQTSSKVGP
jgi:membrane-bound lytic murein transglycosylase A